jgi:hypothetical protein
VIVLLTAVQKQTETSVLDIVRPGMMQNTAVPVDIALLLFCAVIPICVILIVIQGRLALQAGATVRPWQIKAHMRICHELATVAQPDRTVKQEITTSLCNVLKIF